jgi:hypothetical protein
MPGRYLKYPVRLVLFMVGLMSGGFSLVREVYGFSTGALPARSVFSICVWCAFILSAVVLWVLEFRDNEALRHRVEFTRPRHVLEATYQKGGEWKQHREESLFWVHNIGARAGSFVSIEPIKSLSGKFTLRLSCPDVILPGQRPSSRFQVIEDHPLLKDQEKTEVRFWPEMLIVFLKDNPNNLPEVMYDIRIRCKDLDGSNILDTMKLRCTYDPLRLKVLAEDSGGWPTL